MRTYVLLVIFFLTNVFYVAEPMDDHLQLASIVAPKISWTNQQKTFSVETYFERKSHQCTDSVRYQICQLSQLSIEINACSVGYKVPRVCDCSGFMF